MWTKVREAFQRTPSRLKVAQLFLESGFRVTEEGIFAGSVELSTTKIARALGVDRKVVEMTAQVILSNKSLREVFSKLKPVADVSDVARYSQSRYGVMEVFAVSSAVGIAAQATSLLAKENISIRYMLCKDPVFSVESSMVIVTDRRIPGRVVDQLLANPNVISVTLS